MKFIASFDLLKTSPLPLRRRCLSRRDDGEEEEGAGVEETWEGRELGSGEAGNSPGGCWPQADLVSPSGLQPALPRSLELSPSLGGSQAGCAPGLHAGAKGSEFLPTRFLAGHPLTMKARLLERVPIGFLPAP